jgi:hypothetical protein
MKIILCLCVLCVFLSCSESPTTPGSNNSISTLYPLKVGNVWNYHLIEYRSSGQIKLEQDFTIRVVDSLLDTSGNITYLTVTTLKNDTNVQYYNNGIDLYSGRKGTSDIILRLRYPMAAGQTIVLSEIQGQGYLSRYLLQYISSAESVTVPAGTFNCLRYDYIFLAGSSTSTLDTVSTTTMYLALNTGMVEQKDYFYEGGSKYLRYHVRLLSYDLK